MTFLPIVERELRVQARSTALIGVKCTAAAFSSVVVLAVLILHSRPDVAGRGVFGFLAFIAFAYCIVEGARKTADCLSSEKRDGTLGLLFLTDLKGHDVVLGKLAGNSLGTFYGLMAAFPALALPILTGGVTGAEFWRLIIVLMITLLWSASVGMAVSAMGRDEARVWVGTGLAITLLIVLPACIENLLVYAARVQVRDAWFLATPWRLWRFAFESSYALAPAVFWKSAITLIAMAMAMIGIAAWWLPRSWQEQAPLLDQLFSGRTPRLLKKQRPTAPPITTTGNDPVLWLAKRCLPHPTIGLIALACGVAAVLAIASAQAAMPVLIPLFLLCHVALVVGAAIHSSRLMVLMCGNGAAELLLTTPLPPGTIIAGQVRALTDVFMKPIGILLGTESLAVFLVVLTMLDEQPRVIPFTVFTLFWAVAIIGIAQFIFWLQMRAAAYRGLHFGLRFGRTAPAATKTVLHVIILPSLSLVFYCLWPLVIAVTGSVLSNRSMLELQRNFRVIAASQGSAGASSR